MTQETTTHSPEDAAEFIAPSLTMPKQWETFQQDPERMAQLEDLVTQTHELTRDMHGAPAWVHNTSATRLRWQHTIEVCAVLHNYYDVQGQPGARLRDGFDHMTRSIAAFGWEVPGIQLTFHGTEVNTDRRADKVDLRDMDEPVPLFGISFEEFKKLSDEEIEKVRVNFLKEALQKKEGTNYTGYFGDYSLFTLPGTASDQHVDDARQLGQWRTWKRYGKPDKEVPYEDIVVYAGELLASQMARDPAYGAIPESWNGLTKAQKGHANSMLGYLLRMRKLDEQPYFDDYSLRETIGSTYSMAEKLAAKGVLTIIERFDTGKPATIGLAQPYEDFWFANHPALRNPKE